MIQSLFLLALTPVAVFSPKLALFRLPAAGNRLNKVLTQTDGINIYENLVPIEILYDERRGCAPAGNRAQEFDLSPDALETRANRSRDR
jgi:hypothetical protein